MSQVEWIGKNRKAIAPIRISSAGQEGNTSHTTQKRENADYCKKMGLELIEIVPIVESAKTSENRKKYRAVLNRLLKEGIQHLVFHRIDREARNLTDYEETESLIREGKLVIHYVVDGKIFHKGTPDSDFFNRDINAAISKQGSRENGTKARRGQLEKAKSGYWPGTRPPDGYIQQKLKSEKGFERRRGSIQVPDPNPLVVKRVQREFEIRAEIPTPSLREVRRRVVTEGLVPPDKIKNYHTGSIERRLKNKFYDARFDWDGVEYPGKHERIITQELFWKVQATFGIKTPYRKNPAALFGNGWIKCADPACGCDVTFDPKTKKIKTTGEVKTYKYYRCSNGKHVHAGLKSVSEESIMDQFGGSVRAISIREDFRDELMRAVNETLMKMRRAVKDDLERYEAALVAVKEREDRAYDRYDAGDIDRETYNRQRKRLQEEQFQYAAMMKQAQLTINDAALETVESIIELATNAESLWKHMTTEERRSLLDKLLSNRALDGVTVEYEIVKPLRTLSEMREDQKWRARVDDFITDCLAHAA